MDGLIADLTSTQSNIAHLQLEIVMLEAKGRPKEAAERRATMAELKKRAAVMREEVGLPSEESEGQVPLRQP